MSTDLLRLAASAQAAGAGAGAEWHARRRGESLSRAGKDVVGRSHYVPENCNLSTQEQADGNDGFTGRHGRRYGAQAAS